jgi:hypothetical protein
MSLREVPTAAHPEFSPLSYILGIVLDVRGTNHARSYALFVIRQIWQSFGNIIAML